MGLEDIVNVSISSTSSTPTRPGFGVPLLAVCKVPAGFTDLVREYASLAEMVEDDFVSTDPAYLMATKVFSQNPKVRKIKVGHRTSDPTQTVTLTVSGATVSGVTYSVDVAGVTYSEESDGTINTNAEMATALAALIDANPTVAASASGAVITMTAAAGTLFDVANWTSNLALANTTADPGISDDLDAILAEDSEWYGLLLDSPSKDEIVAAAAWVEANGKLAVFDSSDSACFDNGSTTDVMATLESTSYARSGVIFNANKMLNYASCAWMGDRFPYDPGKDTWAFKTLAGATVSSLTSGQVNAILAKNGNVYTTIAGVNVTQFGKTASGEYFDVTRFIDWLSSEIKIQIYAALANSQKIPYTDKGVQIIVSHIKSVLQRGIDVGGLSSDPYPEVEVPLVADVDAVTKATRTLPDVLFRATLAGAIHHLEISGEVSV